MVPGSHPSKPPTPPSAIDLLFDRILQSLDASDVEAAKQDVLKLQEALWVTSGRESRQRGGWQYAANFILDTVIFCDVVRSLQEETDVMEKAICLILSFADQDFVCGFVSSTFLDLDYTRLKGPKIKFNPTVVYQIDNRCFFELQTCEGDEACLGERHERPLHKTSGGA